MSPTQPQQPLPDNKLPKYKPGDTANGYVLTEQGEWVPIAPSAQNFTTGLQRDPNVTMIGTSTGAYVVPLKKKHTTRNVLLVLGVLILLSFVGCVALVGGAVNEDSKPTVPGSVSQGLGANDATGDVVLGTAAAPDVIGVTYLPVTITNSSSKRSNYSIEIAANGSDGNRIELSAVYIDSLDPGQITTEQAMFLKTLPAGVVFEVITVQRTASL
jgi:hypothetical protein